MARVATNTSKTNDSVAVGHVKYQVWNPNINWVPSYCNGWDENGNCNSWGGGYYAGGYQNRTANSTVKGVIRSVYNGVFVNNKNVTTRGDDVIETDETNLPSNAVNIQQDDGGTGRVTAGNNNNVYVNGKSVAVVGSSVRTHANTNTTIRTGSNNVYIGG